MQDITAEDILAESEFKNLNEEQAKQTAEFINTLSTIFYSLYKNQYQAEQNFETETTELKIETNQNQAKHNKHEHDILLKNAA